MDKLKYTKELTDKDFEEICLLTTGKEMLCYNKPRSGIIDYFLLVLSDGTEITISNDFYISFNRATKWNVTFDEVQYFKFMYQKYGTKYLEDKIHYDYGLRIEEAEKKLNELKKMAEIELKEQIYLFS